MIESDDRKDDSWRNQVAVWTGHNGNDRNRLEDGEVKEMIIGVRNGQFTWAYGELNRSYPSPLAIWVIAWYNPPLHSQAIQSNSVKSPGL